MPRIKICGLAQEEAVEAALAAGADMIGFVFHPRSPRFVTPARAAELAGPIRGRAEIVALLVDAADGDIRHIAATLRPDWLQLHGRESPAEIARIAEDLPDLRLMKAVGIAEAADLAEVERYGASRASLILLDAKPPRDAAYPGGHGRSFDWGLLAGLAEFSKPLLLSGGLDAENVGSAMRRVADFGIQLWGLDVSSGVESAPGVKDPAKIHAFAAAIRAAAAAS